MTGLLTGKVALVTGAGRGFGLAIATAFLAEGATVVAHHRSSAAAVERLADTAPGRVTPVRADLREPAGGPEVVRAALAAHGRIDLLVNNAGSMAVGGFAESTEDDWARDIELNIWATLRVTRAAVPGMMAAGSGRIINLSSQLALRPWDRGAVYAGTKGFLLTWTKSLAAELGPYGINVNAIGPGSILTDMNREVFPDEEAARRKAAELPLRRLGSPADVAGAAVFLAGPGSSFMTGQFLGVNGGSQM